jgi:integrase
MIREPITAGKAAQPRRAGERPADAAHKGLTVSQHVDRGTHHTLVRAPHLHRAPVIEFVLKRIAVLPSRRRSDKAVQWLASRFKATDDFVFAATSGRPMSQEWARKVWVRLRDRTGISPRVRFHDMRHTFASILISSGASPVELAEQLGDSVQVAMSTYASLFGRVESEEKLRCSSVRTATSVGITGTCSSRS